MTDRCYFLFRHNFTTSTGAVGARHLRYFCVSAGQNLRLVVVVFRIIAAALRFLLLKSI